MVASRLPRGPDLAAEGSFVTSPCPASSPDLAPSDLFLFRALKGRNPVYIDKMVEEMTDAIPPTKVEAACLKREERLQRWIDTAGLCRLKCDMI
jgi:hypothetical protein